MTASVLGSAEASLGLLPPPTEADIQHELQSLAGRRVAVAMSGGVDSAVAAMRLCEAGAEVIGLAARLYDPDPEAPSAERACCPPEELQGARRIAERLGVPFYVVDARERFHRDVIQPFVNHYLSGLTPNPCVGCNRSVKLSGLLRQAKAMGCVALATGHYVRRRRLAADRVQLYRSVDPQKDQSYFLFETPARELSEMCFPLGALHKDEVRSMAERLDLGLEHKLESQEVCFVGGEEAGAFVEKQANAPTEGIIEHVSGEPLGRHPGIMHFTIGQRKGLGVASSKGPLYVLNIDAKAQKLTVGPAEALLKSGLLASGLVWHAPKRERLSALAKIRYRDRGQMADLEIDHEAKRVKLLFERPVRAIAPGQAVVFYEAEALLGGAWIEEALP